MFRKHHYLSGDFNKAAQLFLIYWDDTLVGMHSVLPLPTNALKYAFRAHRLVILPDFQGLGIGTKINQFFGEYYISQGLKYFMRTTHVRLARNMDHDGRWKATNSSGKVNTKCNVNNPSKITYDDRRAAVSYEYRGDDYISKPHKTIVVDNDDPIPTEQELLDLKSQYYLTVVTGQQLITNECETLCKKLGIRTELLYSKIKGVVKKIKKWENFDDSKIIDIEPVEIPEIKPMETNIDEFENDDIEIELKSEKSTIYIYDIEVFSDDWIVVFRNPDSKHHIVVHNDVHRLRAFLDQPDIIIGGFNNKHYDNYVLLTMLLGGSNYEVKRINDFIITEKNNGWEYPFVQYQKLPVKTFDLKDDLPRELSLKAIEGNMNLPIVESSVPFDINRKLTDAELDEVIRYCKYDVDSTIKLYWARKDDYLDAKIMVGEMYGLKSDDAVGLTNAKLSARVLDAKSVTRNDERDYVVPDNIDIELIPDIVMNFFMQIRDKSIPDTKLFGDGKGAKGLTLKLWLKTKYGKCPVTYAWGGVHGAKPCVTVEETENRVIINQDVASLYPNSMINFGYCSRSMADPKAYEKLVHKRLDYKRNGQKREASALKLVVNTVYGAMLNKHNDLADRWAGRSVCISNQLAMTALIVSLAKSCETIDFININTDGIMFTIDKSEIELSEIIVQAWSEITKFEMEKDDFKNVIQKDVNNYIGIKPDGSFKTKGGFVSLYAGGDFESNSLSIIDKSVVEYLVNNIPVEQTINECSDIFAFQRIEKTGSTFEGAYQYINGERIPIQKVNRIYAVNNPMYGPIVKGKWITEKRKKDKTTGKMISYPVEPPVWQETTISDCPDHAFIDNENVLTVDDIDKAYYIDMAKKRVDKYINIDKKVENELKKIKQEVVIMATEKTTKPENVFAKLNIARERFLNSGIKKTGVNRYAEYKYFTLDDIIPAKQRIFKELGLSDVISFGTEVATLTLVNVDNPEETIEFMSPLEKDESLIKNPIQKLGAVETYVRRYLYMLMLDIVESDAVEIVTDKPVDEDNKPVESKPKKSNRPATTEERDEIKKELTAENGPASETQVKAIKNGLKKLRAKDGDYEDFIGSAIKLIKVGITSKEAEDMLIDIGEKIAE